MSDKGLGRIHIPDERDRFFPFKGAIKKETVMPTSKYWYANGWWGNQGDSPQCVGFSWAHWVEDGPVGHKGKAPIIPPDDIYKEAQKIDDWLGEDYDGTSVRAGAKYLASKGAIKEYRWTWNINDVAKAVLTTAPIVVGTNWYEGMFEPNSKDIVKIGGDIAGGHAYVINGVNTKTRMFRIKNSWGKEWGNNGHAYISFSDMERLINEDGEACLAIESLLPSDL